MVHDIYRANTKFYIWLKYVNKAIWIHFYIHLIKYEINIPAIPTSETIPKRYYLMLPEELICTSPVLMAGMSMLQSILMNQEESERWYHLLEEYAAKSEGSAKREARSRLLYLDIGLPHPSLFCKRYNFSAVISLFKITFCQSNADQSFPMLQLKAREAPKGRQGAGFSI